MDSKKKHRPLLSGIAIGSYYGTTRRYRGSGTLTGLATRRHSGNEKKVLVTNMHVMASQDSDGNYRDLDTARRLYRPTAASNTRVGTGSVQHVPV